MYCLKQLQLMWHKYWIRFHNESRHHHFKRRDIHLDEFKKLTNKE
jgi:hypothetical protein